jgi:hypothetical protein
MSVSFKTYCLFFILNYRGLAPPFRGIGILAAHGQNEESVVYRTCGFLKNVFLIAIMEFSKTGFYGSKLSGGLNAGAI